LARSFFNARFISIALGGRTVLGGAQLLIASFIRIALGGLIIPVDAPRFISIAFGGHIVLVGAPRFIRITLSDRMVLVDAQLLIASFIRIALGVRPSSVAA
jgi:hypothetical protein